MLISDSSAVQYQTEGNMALYDTNELKVLA
jgi:hypothetical protein